MLISLLNCAKISAQAINNQIKDVVMPSPNAASLGKYGDIPVGYYTGVPSVGIPIHTVKEGSVSLPISLNYHAGGVKVGEPNSWVGLGWSLSAGGIISRTVQGKADESVSGYFSIGNQIGITGDSCITRTINGTTSSGISIPDAQFNSDLSKGNVDGEPDIFNFSIGGYSGKFYIDADNTNNGIVDGKVILVPKQDLKVEYSVSASTSVNRLYKFTITTPEGTKYEFGNNNDNLTDVANDAIEITLPFNGLCDRYASSWYLKRIISVDGYDVITLNYKKENYRYGYRASAGAPSQNTLSAPQGGYRAGIIDILGCRLDNITTSTAKEVVAFIASTDNRQDLDIYGKSPAPTEIQKAKRLSAITVTAGSFCKQFILSHDYFEDNLSAKSGQYTDFRLRLNRVQEANCSGLDSVKPYIFTYYQNPNNPKFLPNRLSGAIDHWGYYNGAAGNSRAGLNIPHTRLRYVNINGSGGTTDVKEGFSNRETNQDSMKLGAMRQIQYPTGGTTTFDYEANTYWDSAGVKKIQADGDFSLYWTDGGQCSRNNTSPPFYKTFDNVDDMFYAWATKKARNYCTNCSCTDISNNPSNVILNVFQGNATTALWTEEISCGSNDTIVNIKTDNLLYLFPYLQTGVNYRFELTGSNSASKFMFQKEVLVDPALNNRKVGGLRIKSMTISDGINTTNNIVKTYDYSSSIPSISSGVLYNKPIYGHIFRNDVGHCNDLSSRIYMNHIFMENAIVPLSSFEGYSVGYRKVKEYINNGFGTEYNYEVEGSEPFLGFPRAPEPPKIRSGELLSKVQFDAPLRNPVASQTITPNNDPYEVGQGTFIKFNNFTFGGNTNTQASIEGEGLISQFINIYYSGNSNNLYFSTWSLTYNIYSPSDGLNGSTASKVIGFWKKYSIRTRPNRVKETKSVINNVETITKYTYDYSNRFLAPFEVTTTNSDGKEVVSRTYYAANLPNDHPNYANRTDLMNKYMIGIPLQTEQYVRNDLQSSYTTVGGSRLVYQGNYPYQAYSLNKNLTWKLNVTVDEYTNGLPTKMTKAGFWIQQIYAYDAYRRVTNKNFGGLNTAVQYYTATSLPSQIIDENGFKSTFNYDGLMRLKESKSYFFDNTLRSTTNTIYTFGGAANPSCNAVRSSIKFEGIADPLSTKQLFDGLGRPTQGLKLACGPNKEHIKSAVTYDNLGRQDLGYQPFIAVDTSCKEAIPSGTLYVQTKYEDSPLSRPIKQIAEDGKFVTMDYGSNTANEVRRFIVTNGANDAIASAADFYAINTLYKTTITNENGTTTPNGNVNKTDVFKDILGRVILTRKYLDNTEAGKIDTYNIYDDYGNLIMVIPPGALDAGNNIIPNLVFSYKYNNKNLLCEKKIPGADPQKFYYDNRDLLVMSQDGNMRAANPNRYLATTYDEIGRKWQTGFMETATPETDLANWIYSWVPINPGSTVMGLTYTYYLPNTAIPYAMNIAAVGNRSTGDRETMFRGVNYNAKREKEWSCPEYLRYHNCEDWVFNTDGTLKLSTKYNNGPATAQLTSLYQIFYSQKYLYDHARRDTAIQQQLWGPTSGTTAFFAPWTELSAINYNYKDQVIEKNIGRRTDIWGAKALQSIDYQYNQRGWLTAINQMPLSSYNQVILQGGSPVLSIFGGAPTFNIQTGEGSVDLFSESIRYGNPDAGISNIGTPQYNGNISQSVWQVAGREQQAYTYKYDALDRLLEGEYTDIHDTEGPQIVGQTPYSTDNKFKEKLTYDVRGNITSLIRNGMIAPGFNAGSVVTGTFGEIDNLVYIYGDSNRVKRITDGANATKGFKYRATGADRDYDYDKNGNLVADRNKGITRIVYNYMNLPERIEFISSANPYQPVIEFVYDATGMKLRKTTTLYNQNLTTIINRDVIDYMDGFEYKNNTIERIHHAEGVITQRALRTGESTEFVGAGGLVWQYEYTLKDHLGNTRVTFADIDGSRTIEPNTEISQINHYYPFGLNMEGNWNGASPDAKNKFQYNGKELQTDFGLDLNDFGARMYDPNIGRWLSPDPLAEKFMRYSPYNYALDNPLKFIDPNGMEAKPVQGNILSGGPDDPRDKRIKKEVSNIMLKELKKGNAIDEMQAQLMVAIKFQKADWYRGADYQGNGNATHKSNGLGKYARFTTLLEVQIFGKAEAGKNLVSNRDERDLPYNTGFKVDVADKLKEGTLKGGTIDVNFNTRGAFENIQVKYQTSDGEKILSSAFSASDVPQAFSGQINVSDLTSNSIEVTVVGNNRIGTGDITMPNTYDLNIQVKGTVTGELKQTRINYPIIQTNY